MGENLHKLSSLKRLQNILIWSEKIISSIYQNTNLLFPDHTLLWWSDRKKMCMFGNYLIFYILQNLFYFVLSPPLSVCWDQQNLALKSDDWKKINSIIFFRSDNRDIHTYLKGNNITPNLFWVGNGLTSSHSTLYTHQSQRRTWWREQSFFSTFFIYFFLVSFLLIDINYSGISSANFFLEKCKWVIHICLN